MPVNLAPTTIQLPLRLAFCSALLQLATAVAAADAGSGSPPPKPRFDIWEYQVTGNSRLGDEQIERAVYAFLGEDKSIDDVEKARSVLEQSYREAGYAAVSVEIPEQAVSQGIVELHVTEARIDRVKVSGGRYYAQDRILAAMPALAEGEPPDFEALQKQLAAVNVSPDRRVQPLLRPGRQPGTTEIELKLDDNLPLHGNVELNDKYGPSKGPDPGKYRAAISLRYDNLWQREHSISLSYLTSPTKVKEAKVFSAAYALPLAAGGTLSLYGVRSRNSSDLTTSLAGTGVLGSGDIVGLRLNKPLRDAAGLHHGLTFGLDYKHFLEDLTQQGSGTFPTPLTYWLGSVQYAASAPDSGGDTSIDAGLSLSLRGARNNEQQFADKRFLGAGNFAVVHWGAQRLQRFGNYQLIVRAEGQLASNPLPSNEEYSAGGVDSVRGYPEAVQIGDQGVRGMVEARTPNLLAAASEAAELRLLAFVEGAHLRIMSPQQGQQARYTLASRGLGLRLAGRNGMTASFDYGWRLKDGMTTDTHGSVLKNSGRWHFDLAYQF
jgi:hemolysin activation/secretion protein